MKKATSKKAPTPSKRKLSFSVDRSEFDINSDWVQAVMAPPGAVSRKDLFFAPPINNATDTEKATEAIAATGAEITSGAENTGVAEIPSVVENAMAAVSVAQTSPEEEIASVANSATDNVGPIRTWKLRPLRRITDGLTPGQYAVYSLMLENSEPGQGSERTFRGGYADLNRLTGLSKRGIQNVIGELQDKAVIRLHTAPGHHRYETSVYEVPQPGGVLAQWQARGWRFALGKSKRLTDGTTVAVLATVAR